MKKNTSVFTMIGLIFLAYGQLQSSSSVQKRRKIERLGQYIRAVINTNYDEGYFSRVDDSFNELIRNIEFLNTTSKKEKNMKKTRLVIDDFAATASALQTIDNSINSLPIRLSKIFINGKLLLNNNLDKFIIQQREQLSRLKTDLYNIYEVRREADDKISVRYYTWLPAENKPAFYYSDPLDDLLADIKPSVDKIEERRIGQKKFRKRMEVIAEEEAEMEKITLLVGAGGEEPDLMKALVIQAAAMLGVEWIEQLVEAAAIKPTVLRGTSRARIKRGSTGLLDIVELKMASPPIIQRRRNGEILSLI